MRHTWIVFISLLILTLVPVVPAQEPEQEQAYSEEEYAKYKAVDEEANIQKKVDMLIQFLKEYPKSLLKPYLVSSFQRDMNDLYQKQQWSQVISLGNKFLSVVPNDQVTIQTIAYAYSTTGDQKGFVTFATKMYEASPNVELAYSVAIAYLRMQNDAQFLQWGDRVLESSPDRVEILVQMIAKTSGSRQEKYARMALKGIPNAKKPEGMDESTWEKTVKACYGMSYGVLGGAAYQSGDYGTAITDLTKAVEYNKKNETAYYFLGMSYWQVSQTDSAMLNLAKAYLLKGSTSVQSKNYLDQLWKQSHFDSLNGIETILQRAQKELD